MLLDVFDRFKLEKILCVPLKKDYFRHNEYFYVSDIKKQMQQDRSLAPRLRVR